MIRSRRRHVLGLQRFQLKKESSETSESESQSRRTGVVVLGKRRKDRRRKCEGKKTRTYRVDRKLTRQTSNSTGEEPRRSRDEGRVVDLVPVSSEESFL